MLKQQDAREISKIKTTISPFIGYSNGNAILRTEDLDAFCERLYLRGLRQVNVREKKVKK